MALHFLKVQKKSKEVIWLYRKCIRIIQKLIPTHQKIWYDYVRLKYGENTNVTNPEQIKKLVKSGYEELEWIETVLTRKNGQNS